MTLKPIGSQVIHLDTTDSTNMYASRLLGSGQARHGTVVRTAYQEKGRGQDQSTWFSDPGKNLLFSVVLSIETFQAEKQFMINKIISLGITDYLTGLSMDPGSHVSIKWPNDVYIGNKKAGGILIQNQIKGQTVSSSIIGIGLNINQDTFPDSLPNPVSIKQITGRSHDLEKSFTSLLDHLNGRMNQFLRGKEERIHRGYLRRLFQVNQRKKYKVPGRLIQGTITGVDEFGRLIIVDEQGNTLTLNMKEVIFL
ncbi:MAG: biotin--[acetyl-CoA-carboxylase] ligase [Bacteroidales bacterium]